MTRRRLLGSNRFLFVTAALWLVVGSAQGQFETRASTPLTSDALATAVGDFNGDGKLDIALCGNALSILLGNGDGTFRPGASMSAVCDALAVADFNNDGIPDLVVAPTGVNNVEVFIGNGGGTFQAPISSPITNSAEFIATGDFNGDHKMDIVIVDLVSVSVLLGNGDGTFQAPSDNLSFLGPHYLAVGDFNGDHNLDVAVAGFYGGSTEWGILLGNGDGTLQDAVSQPLEFTPCSVVTADFNRDGKEDVAVGYCGGASLVALGVGDGTFEPGVTYDGAGDTIIAADFNGDGKLDLVGGPSIGTGVGELLGNRDGTFQAAVTYDSSSNPFAAGDLNGDHRLDVLLSVDIASIVSMLNTGAMQFSPSSAVSFPAQVIGTKSPPQTVTLTNGGTGALTIRSMKTSGSFQTRTTCGSELTTGASCSISAVFAPLKAGGQKGGITIVDSASSKPQFIELYGSATPIETSPNGLQFGKQKVGTQSAPKTVTVTNVGSAAVTFQGVSVNGPNNHDFIESDNCARQTIAPQGSCTVTIIFKPSKTGPESGNLHIRPDRDTVVAPAPLPLRGTGE